MTVRFLRVSGVRSTDPVVLAIVEEYLVRWRADGWTCECAAEGDTCSHVDAVAGLLDERVLGGER